MPMSLSPPVEVVIVNPPRLPTLGGDAAFSAIQTDIAGAQRLDDALKQAPGVSLFRRNGSDAANPTTQGLSLRAIAPSGAGRTLVTLEGAPVNDPFGGWVIWSALPPEGLEAAVVVRGAGGGPYGAGALTGVVALHERGAGEGLLALDLSAGQRGGWRAAAAGGGPGLLVTASFEGSDGYTPVRGRRAGAADQPLKLQTGAFAFRVQHQIGAANTALRVGVYRERRGSGLRGAASTAEGASVTLTAAADRWRLQTWLRASDLANSSVAVAASRATTTPANEQYATPAVGYGLNGAIQGKLGRWKWEAGADGRLTSGEERERFRFMSGEFTRHREAGGRTGVVGAYLDASLDDGPWLVTGGGRIDAWANWRSHRQERDLQSGAAILDQTSPRASGVTPTGRLGLRFAMTPDVWVRAAAYAGFRPPTLNELHRPFRVGNDITEANPALKPETLQGIEAGVGGKAWALTIFANRLRDPITNVTIGAGPGTFPTAGFVPAGGVLRRRQNAGQIEAWGFEGEGAASLSADLRLRAAFSWTRARVDGGADAPQLTGLRPAQAPAWTVTAGLNWRPLNRLSLTLDARYESRRFEDDLNTRVLDAGLQADARIGWRLADDAEVYLAADNLTGGKLETGETADGVESYAAPRTLRVGLSLRR